MYPLYQKNKRTKNSLPTHEFFSTYFRFAVRLLFVNASVACDFGEGPIQKHALGLIFMKACVAIWMNS